MKQFDIDEIDKRILRVLSVDGRISITDLARQAATSTATCFRRVQRLTEDGIITGFRADICPASVGRSAVIVMGVCLDRLNKLAFAEFEAAIRDHPLVISCHLVSGEFDYLVTIRASSIDEFNAIYGDWLVSLPGIRMTRTFFSMKEVVQRTYLHF
ncbi:Lrp/AsnC family transcriptional regulator [Gluconacetobacter sp. 1b LMG 1731]|uniref:Lrp/AsnC family transcriptional regulator n=1 Tax=Gluconacetobacter dulcium TaxID=2729096 RepID=A0A7W4IKX1_9PROT|nr:Lrp/AsnC family transcriptional regulator [Gluconacetobacter dulcium]MBB2164768.1 Lrp/AsnC family transcriptional regulator [Gluconacetobacter dulcium]MBB2193904.1 Lrp/AsnC family transcriptional regulator [Gluconacetobacter dulcium]MBB2196353.1 Lrp/AsnC family transcriptional regulator [Gluconacetobacter dulcium]